MLAKLSRLDFLIYFPGFYAFLNCRSTKLGTKLGLVFSVSKIIALLFIIITGAGYMLAGNTDNFRQPWRNSSSSPGQVALGAINAYFAYKGWSVSKTLAQSEKTIRKSNINWISLFQGMCEQST